MILNLFTQIPQGLKIPILKFIHRVLRVSRICPLGDQTIIQTVGLLLMTNTLPDDMGFIFDDADRAVLDLLQIFPGIDHKGSGSNSLIFDARGHLPGPLPGGIIGFLRIFVGFFGNGVINAAVSQILGNLLSPLTISRP